MYRKDIFDKHSIAAPDGPDSWYNALKKLKEIYPDSTPLVNKYKSGIFNFYTLSWGTSQTIHYQEEKTKWEYGPISDEFKDMVIYFTRLYEEGLIDPAFMTASADDWTAKMTQDDHLLHGTGLEDLTCFMCGKGHQSEL